MRLVKIEKLPSIMGISSEELQCSGLKTRLIDMVENYNLMPKRQEVSKALDALKSEQTDQYFVTAIERLKAFILL